MHDVDPFSPIAVNGVVLPNRFVRSATHDGSADDSGRVTQRSLSLFRDLAEGDIGLIVTGYAYVSSGGQAVEDQYGVHRDEMIPGLARLAEEVHRAGGTVALQVAHAGMQSLFFKHRGLSCPAVSQIEGSSFLHREMSGDEIESVIRDFGAAGARAREAGFDAVQLHGAHGYLFSQFLSPLRNRRTDIWGGSAENRRRFHIEVVRELRSRVGPRFPLLIKFGVMDDDPGGVTLEEGVAAAREMAAAGVDAIEVSFGIGGGFMKRILGRRSAAVDEQPYFRQRAAAVKGALSIPVMLAGGIRSMEAAREILDAGDADMVSMSRPFVREPWLVKRWREGDDRPANCISCNQCFRPVRETDGLPDSYCWQEYLSRRRGTVPEGE